MLGANCCWYANSGHWLLEDDLACRSCLAHLFGVF